VRVPWRLVESAEYSDAALAVYVKVAALGSRPEGCTAGAARIAEYLGVSKSTVERGLRQLRQPCADGVVELPAVQRRSLRGGSGTTAVRRVRPVGPGELFVWVPVLAAEVLTPRQLRAFAVISYTTARRIPLTERELAVALRHHHGQRAGEPLSVWVASGLIDELESKGWIAVSRRAGERGRHQFVVHDSPVSVVADPAELLAEAPGGAVDNLGDTVVDCVSAVATVSVGDGSGPWGGDGSLAYKESPTTDRPENSARPAWSPAVGEVQVGGAREAATVPRPRGRGRLALRAEVTDRPHRRELLATGAGGRGLAPQLSFSVRVWRVLEPVQLLLPGVNAYMLRRIGREVGQQLDEGTVVERLRHRLEVRYAHTMRSDIRDAGRWLVGVALPRRGCAHPDCESGVLWSTGAPCRACAQLFADRRTVRGLVAGAATVGGELAGCGGTSGEALGGRGGDRSGTGEAFTWRAWWSCHRCDRSAPGEAPASGMCRACRDGSQGSEARGSVWQCGGCGRSFERARPTSGVCLPCEQYRPVAGQVDTFVVPAVGGGDRSRLPGHHALCFGGGRA
jgi:hypothetical protein